MMSRSCVIRVSIICVFVAYMRLWKITGQGNYEPVTTSYHYQIYENGSLTIQDVTKNDAGFYLCQATNDVGPGLSSVISLNVHSKFNLLCFKDVENSDHTEPTAR